MDWTHLTQDRDQWQALVNRVNEPSGSINVGKFLSSYVTVGFPRGTRLHEASLVSQLIS
jgi:hypothetical protein